MENKSSWLQVGEKEVLFFLQLRHFVSKGQGEEPLGMGDGCKFILGHWSKVRIAGSWQYQC